MVRPRHGDLHPPRRPRDPRRRANQEHARDRDPTTADPNGPADRRGQQEGHRRGHRTGVQHGGGEYGAQSLQYGRRQHDVDGAGGGVADHCGLDGEQHVRVGQCEHMGWGERGGVGLYHCVIYFAERPDDFERLWVNTFNMMTRSDWGG